MSGVLTAAGDLRRLVVRDLRRELRVLDSLIVNIALPVIIMELFVYVFGGAITGLQRAGLHRLRGAAVLLVSGGYGAALTAVSMAGDLTGGMIDRFRTLPIGGWVVPAVHVVASVVRNVAACAFALVAAIALGFRPSASPVGWALVTALVAAYVLAMSDVAGAAAGGEPVGSSGVVVAVWLAGVVVVVSVPVAAALFGRRTSA
ncbi:hypothetical protein EDD27_1603 [Nonomuraea polychroma]|uniref:ABC-2 type transporter transmembrane domain-containing protein n=1 Tax=Nonomuraea polychroma TaxID=46176 RepID=A0A438M0D5_9ACTN|nr:ABC transporter permease [Nonomuraea polychroma]RVX39255.1 hypothetical protein EDD27_1603 [Nonomuraea polychroma]